VRISENQSRVSPQFGNGMFSEQFTDCLDAATLAHAIVDTVSVTHSTFWSG
jgi:hypothetical protein